MGLCWFVLDDYRLESPADVLRKQVQDLQTLAKIVQMKGALTDGGTELDIFGHESLRHDVGCELL